jgi:hypothetical protein
MIDGKIRAIYVHHDGYLSGVGADLQEYATLAEVDALLDEGDRSSLESGFYKDRGENDVDPITYDTFDEFYDACKNSWGEYYYVWKDGVWYCGDTYGDTSISHKMIPYIEAVELTKQTV